MTLEASAREPGLVGQYRLLQRLGEGGMGVVHLGLDPAGRAVAIKVLRPHVAADPDARRRLAREVATLRRVRHPRVAAVIDADVDGEVPFLVTHFVPGKPLDVHVRDHGPLARGHIARFGAVLADALRAIHAAGVVHRDVKPANVMLLDGDPILIDFGIAHLADESRITHTGLVMGTPGYLSPEIIGGESVTEATDWWGWGATLAFAATGRPPFGTGPIEVVLDRVRRGASDIQGVDAGLRATLTAALSVDPTQRPTPDRLVMGLSAAAPVRRPVAPPVARPDEALTERTPPPGEASTSRTPPPADSRTSRRPPPSQPSQPWSAQEAATALVPPPIASPPIAPPPVAGTRTFGSPEQPANGFDRPPRPSNQNGQNPNAQNPNAHNPNAQNPPAPYPPTEKATERATEEATEEATRSEGDPTRGVVIGLLVVLAAVAAVAPYGAAWLAALGMVAARVVDRTNTALLQRRDQRGGRSGSDHVLTVAALPYRVIRAGLSTILMLILPILVGVSVAFIVATAAAGAPARAIPGDPGPLAVGMVALLLTAWFGPGGSSVRRGTHRVVRAVVPGRRAQIVTWSIVGLVLISALIVISSGTGPDWGPLEQSPIVDNLTAG